MPYGDTLKLIGRTIAEKYAVESVVGEGGFATVYKAMHVIWKRPVALKVFKALGDFSEKDRQKLLDEFIQEGALLADLSARTAAIVQARDIGMLDGEGATGVPFMVLEWLEGATLEAVLADEKARGLPLRTRGRGGAPARSRRPRRSRSRTARASRIATSSPATSSSSATRAATRR